jgi:16S rRNA G527 N7-methylase RsmG
VTLVLDAPTIEAALRPRPDAAVAERLATWSRTLNQWQRAQRLVGWRTGAALLEEGLADAWVAARLLDEAPSGPLLELGSGAGLPGLIIAAAWPEREIHLVEARRKRASFLRAAARAMGLARVTVHGARSEALREQLELQPAVVSARAFAPPADVLAEAAAWGAEACLISSSAAAFEASAPGSTIEGWVFHVERAGRPRGADRVHRLFLKD